MPLVLIQKLTTESRLVAMVLQSKWRARRTKGILQVRTVLRSRRTLPNRFRTSVLIRKWAPLSRRPVSKVRVPVTPSPPWPENTGKSFFIRKLPSPLFIDAP